MFKPVDPKQNFPKLEEAILKIWEENKTFQKSIEKGEKDYIFYDGPPFATGLPHYGHLLAGTIKDVIPRYFTMQGYRVERKWGWDCHGLPVENIVEKELDLGSKTDIEEYGIANFNEACRAVVLRYAEEWKKTVRRMGRWVDMENDYKTMNPEFMESIWWVFKSLWDKNLIYEGHKVVPYCPRCSTPLSNFETNQGYKDRQDPALTVKFELENEPRTYLLAWTTTPWTLPSNLALAVGPEITYAKIKVSGERRAESGESTTEIEASSSLHTPHSPLYIVALDRIPHLFKDPSEYEIVDQFLGETLKGQKYKPLLPYFADKPEEKAFTVSTGNFVTLDSGTGIVHMAPYGEDDMAVIHELGIELVDPLDAEAKFRSPVNEFQGLTVFDANPLIIKKLKEENKVVKHETINHSYPHCWRCDTPLIYRPISTWFVKVEELKTKLLQTNQDINWVPDHIKEGRFGKWLEGARDWAISRNRYWGTPLPIWRCDCGEIKCVGSREELEKLTGQSVQDLHKHKIDGLTFDCEKCPNEVKITHVRHGETEWNRLEKVQGSTDNELNETGRKQAEECGEKLKQEKFDLIICSPLKRARETAEIINQSLGLEIVVEDGLRERDYGQREGGTHASKLGLSEEELKKLRLGTANGEEAWDKVLARVKGVYQKYLGKKILVIGHWGTKVATLHLSTGENLVDLLSVHHENGIPHDLIYKNKMRRIPEVLDCWFESGSMPYAQLHYPFENQEKFEANFPAEFIAEGLDQTRGWFYTLHILSNALFDKPAFKNCIVNGIVLAEDGQKMSKRLQNYPDPSLIMETYGADAMRFYLMNSPVVKADDLRFSEKGVADVVRNVILPIWNAYSFFVTYATIDKWEPNNDEVSSQFGGDAELDIWIHDELYKLIGEVKDKMEVYDLQKASNAIYKFVDSLTNFYIRRSRKRFWKAKDDADKNMAYQTLHYILTTLCKIIAPFMPFVSEEIFCNLTGEESVHLSDFPEVPIRNINEVDQKIAKGIDITRVIVSLGLAARAKKKIKVRQPLLKVKIALSEEYKMSFEQYQLDIIQEELNIKQIEFIQNPSDLATVIAKPNAKLLGPKYGKEVQTIIQIAKTGQFERLENGNIKVMKYELTPEEMEIAYLGKEGADIETQAGILVSLDTTITPELEMEGLARDLVRQIQELRKAADYQVNDRIQVTLIGVSADLLESWGNYIKAETLTVSFEDDISDADQSTDFEGIKIKIKRQSDTPS